ncbi:hypothetical protein [Mobilicoccus massiliensis]|uniref:hypothetical protein n=1 Tax=Mobilicoccus massiliensis TaxID=1522310 RepID=UPI000693F639|nr:hypothetical protein [Mobilicoccus massiliensis]
MSLASGPGATRTRLEAVVAAGLVVVTIYGFVAVPLRAWLLGLDPAALAAITGSRPALVAVGALAAAEGRAWLWPLLVATVSILKFHWVFWWAGRLWGEHALVRVAGDTPRARRRIARAEALVRRYQVPAIAVTYVPLPVARELVIVALGTAGRRFRVFVALDLAAAAVTQSLCVLLGAWLGESAVVVVKQYAIYAGWVALVALAAMTVAALRAWRRRRRDGDEVSTRR